MHRCYVYDNFGNEIFVQNKFTPFDYNGKIEELCPTDHEINMLDIEGVGRIIVLICKDITNSKLKDFIGEVKGDILCYPAYSPSLEVITQSRSVSEDFNVISIFSNACAPRISRDTIGYCAVPQKDMTNSSTEIKYYKCEDKNCNNICDLKIISLKFSEFENINNVLRCIINIE